MVEAYIHEGQIARNRIALDVRRRKLTGDRLEAVLCDSRIMAAFIGTSFEKKRPQEEWDESYLEQLSYMVIAESFNAEYLRYLDEVAAYVAQRSASSASYGARGTTSAGRRQRTISNKQRGKQLSHGKFVSGILALLTVGVILWLMLKR